MANQSIYNYRINDFSTPTGWSTSNLFDTTYQETGTSAIDTFNQKVKELNVLILDPKNMRQAFEQMYQAGKFSDPVNHELVQLVSDTTSVPTVFSNLILLGYISAVESFIREILRKLIAIDNYSRKACELKSISYGAALFHTPDMLPEALLENMTFISRDNVEKVLKDFIGITKVAFPSSVSEILIEYENVCQLRHCIVHRFGKLGANNAIKLGLETHSSYIEKPIKLNYAALQKVAAVCTSVVKEVNQFLWQYVMMRLIGEPANQMHWRKKSDSIPWSWDYRRDKKRFKCYFDTFAYTGSSTLVPDIYVAYTDYRNKFRQLI